MNKRVEEHSFSVEMKSEQTVKRMSFEDNENGHVFFEGFLGKLQGVTMVEGLMLQIEGLNGVLRVDIAQEDLEGCLNMNKSAQSEAKNNE